MGDHGPARRRGGAGRFTMVFKERYLDPLPLLDETALKAFLRDAGANPEVHSRYIWKHMFKAGDPDVENVPGLPEGVAAQLGIRFSLKTSSIREKVMSQEDSTIKLVIKLQDDQLVESVIIRHSDDMPRNTLCVSSQIGCSMGCKFCATGTMNLLGNLSSGEILEQLWHANDVLRQEGDPPVSNIVFMGMGEPLDNYDPVISAILGMTDTHRFAVPRKRVSLSTVGVIPAMRRLTREAPFVQLAFSLHAPNQKLRSEIVPSANKWDLAEIMNCLDAHEQAQRLMKSKAKIMIEYVMLQGVNDMPEIALQLGKLLEGHPFWVNLIPYNPTPHAPYKTPTHEAISAFSEIVQTYGVRAMERHHHGRDVNAACGQLALNTTETMLMITAGDIEDLGKGSLNQRAPKKAQKRDGKTSNRKKKVKDTSTRSVKKNTTKDESGLSWREMLVPIVSAIVLVLVIFGVDWLDASQFMDFTEEI